MTFRKTASALILGAILSAGSAHAHGIAGNRFFPGTLTFDDPAVADELATTGTSLKHPDGLGDAMERGVAFSFARLLTDTLAVGFDTGFVHRSWDGSAETGATVTDATIKTLLYRDDLNETLASASLNYGLGQWGAKRVGTNTAPSLQPGLTVGQGFGALPENLAWLRPFGVAGSLSAEFPTHKLSENFTYDPARGEFVSLQTHNPIRLHSGIALEYSTLYLTNRFVPGKLPEEEPLHQLIPLVEFSFDSPRGRKTAATANPGLAYVEDSWQVAAEAIIPMNRLGGSGVGFSLQLLLFLDDFMPSLFEKPVFSR